MRDLRHANPAHAELRQGVLQVGLVVGLERPGHHRARHHAERPGLREIGLQREVRRRVALVRDDREAMVDDMAVAVEQAPA